MALPSDINARESLKFVEVGGQVAVRVTPVLAGPATSSEDTSINGYVTVTLSDGSTAKLATIA